MPIEVKNFGIRSKKVTRLVEERAITVSKRIALATHRRLVKATPVKTGRTSASWTIAVGAPNLNIRPPGRYYVGSAFQRLKATRRNLRGFKLGDEIFIANGAPWIRKLNNGSSRQAPKRFVEAVVREVRTFISTRNPGQIR